LWRLKDIYPQYADRVAFYAVGEDPTEPLQELEAFRVEQGHSWPVASAGQNMLADLKVLSRSNKVAFDRRGIITYRGGYGVGDEAQWRKVFEELASR
jgi:hypothetical protein